MKGVISIFAMPQEIDDLHITLYNLKRNMALVPDEFEMDIHVTLCLSDELTNWIDGPSTMSKHYFERKFESMRPLMDWSKNPTIYIEYGDTILGCVSQRRKTLELYNDYDFTIWLDTDIFFNDISLSYMIAGYKAAVDSGESLCIITPQFVKQWDHTWDMLVHSKYINAPVMFHESFDVFNALLEHGEITLAPLNTYKFAGGWFTLLSNELLNMITIPESLGHYGLEDTFITSACDLLQKHNHKNTPTQFTLQNHLVGENYVHRCNKHMSEPFIFTRNRKEEFRAVATKNFSPELNNFIKRVIHE
jgi:hypothetical protein